MNREIRAFKELHTPPVTDSAFSSPPKRTKPPLLCALLDLLAPEKLEGVSLVKCFQSL